MPKIVVPEPARKQASGPLKLKRWTSAGLLVTYWCNARCAFCYVYSGPDKRGMKMTVAQAVEFWCGLNRLVDDGGASYGRAGERCCKVHLAGGEPFFDFAHLLAIARAAQTAGLRVFEKVETNAFWATHEDVTREKISLLKDAGMERLVISADVYHQEFVPRENCLRAARIGQEVMGEKGIRVRWWEYLRELPVATSQLPEKERKRMFAEALVRHRERLVGRAADALATFYACQPAAAFQGLTCAEATLGSKHVHIDGYGNVFPGVCSGIVWGKIDAAQTPQQPNTEASPPPVWPARFLTIDALWHYAEHRWQDHPVIGRVVEGGSYRLFEYAKKQGYPERAEGYANKCHLCHDVRRWLFARGEFGNALGPREVYGEQENNAGETRRVGLPVLGEEGSTTSLANPGGPP